MAGDRDPVTGAPRLGRSASGGRNWPQYQAAGYQPFYPPYGYAYAGYNPAPFLVPSPAGHALPLPATPNLVPASWVNAYNDYYGSPTPLIPHLALHPERSPRRRSVRLPSPRNSPFGNLIALPPLDDEDEEEEDTGRTWGERLRSWISGQSQAPDAHSQFFQEILVHESLDRRRGIRWNISSPPHTIRINDPPDANESAFNPPLSNCRIVCSLLPWAIEIKTHSQYPYITVMSLLGDLYKSLNKPIDRRTYESLPVKFRELLNESFHQRVYSIPDEEAAQNAYSRGIKRADFLLDKRTYAGISQIGNLMYTFELKLSNARV